MGDELKKNLGAEIELIAGGNGIFEVTLNGRIIFSKAAEKRFPEADELIQRIQK